MTGIQRACLVVSLLFAFAHSQFVPPPTDLTSTTGFLDLPVRYKQVPDGICELTPGVKSYSGYVDIGEEEHIFWWFFEARDRDPNEAELTVWINGGPGSSSMIGLFQELGPCRLDENLEPYNNPYAWNNVSNMLFIDQPNQVGFSYSTPVPAFESNLGDIVVLPENNCPRYAQNKCGTWALPSIEDTTNTTIGSAPQMWHTLQGFTGAFPQYSRSGFNFGSESYGGHWAPVYNEYIKEQNAKIDAGELPGAHKIDLQTVLIGNGWFDPLIQYASYYNFTVNPGNTYNYFPLTTVQENRMYNAMYGRGNCYDQTMDCYRTKRSDICSAADNFCYTEVEYLLDLYALRDEYDIRYLMPDPFPETYYVDYLNLEHVQQAIGAFVNYSEASPAISSAFGTTGDDDRLQGSVMDTTSLVEQGVYVVMFNGDADYICNWIGNLEVADNVDAAGWSNAGFQNITSSDGIVHGDVKQSDNFVFARIYEAGHLVPYYQPLVSLEMFERAIEGLDIATGQERVSKGGGYLTEGPATSEYREGRDTVTFRVWPQGSVYNTTTSFPEPPPSGSSSNRSQRRRKRRVNSRFG